jgi:hypothetical protein
MKLNWKIGFTGTRTGMTADQLAELRRRLTPPNTDWGMFSEFHHGDCEGADEEAHDMMRVLLSRHWPLRVDIYIHPPLNERYRAHCDALMDERELRLVKVLPQKGYLERDRDIVNATDLLIGCPAGFDYRGNGGTSYTLRYALGVGKPTLIIYPDGQVETHNFEEHNIYDKERAEDAAGKKG